MPITSKLVVEWPAAKLSFQHIQKAKAAAIAPAPHTTDMMGKPKILYGARGDFSYRCRMRNGNQTPANSTMPQATTAASIMITVWNTGVKTYRAMKTMQTSVTTTMETTGV